MLDYKDQPSEKERKWAFFAYLFGIPALYLVLTEHRKKAFIGFHASQALLLWVYIFVIFFVLRFVINLLWMLIYIPYLEKLEVVTALFLWGYAVRCAILALNGEMFHLPYRVL